MGVDEHKRVEASKVEWVKMEEFAHGQFGGLTAAVVFDGILSISSTSKEAFVVFVVPLLPSPVCVPPVPDRAEDCCSYSGCGVFW